VGRIAMYDTGAAGGTVKIYTLTDSGVMTAALQCDEKQRTWHRAAVADTLVTIPYSASMTPDASLGNAQTINVTNGTPCTVNAPINPMPGQLLEITVRNVSGSGMGAMTWNAIFRIAAWGNPAPGYARSITVRYDGSSWGEKGRTPGDVPA